MASASTDRTILRRACNPGPMPARLSRRGGVFALILLAAAALGGCAVGRELGTGAPMVGITTEDANGAIAAVGAWGGLIGNLGAVLGIGAPATAAGGLLTWIAARASKKREDAAWDEAEQGAERKALIAALTGGSADVRAGGAAGGVGGDTGET